MQYMALASDVRAKVEKNISDYNKSLTSEEKIESWKRNNSKFVDRYNKFIEEAKYFNSDKRIYNTYHYGCILEDTIDSIAKKCVRNSAETKQIPSKESIYNSIVLESIEDTDTQSLINRLVEKFSK